MRIPRLVVVLAISASAAAVGQPFPEPPVPGLPPESPQTHLRLDRLHDPDSTFYLRFRIEPWANALIGSPLHRLWTQWEDRIPSGSIDNLFDPKALAVARLLIHPGVSQAAYTAWAPAPLGGIDRPRWMLGIATDFEGETRVLLDRFIEASHPYSPPMVGPRSDLGLRFSVGDIEILEGSRCLVFSSHVSLLEAFLLRQSKLAPHPDWPESDAEGFWRPNPPDPRFAPSPNLGFQILQGLGVPELHFSCRTLAPGLEFRVGLIGRSVQPESPLEPAVEFDLLRDAPLGSDFLLVGGARPRSATSEALFELPWYPIAKGLGAPFGLGVDIPSVTSEERTYPQIGGMVRKSQADSPDPLEDYFPPTTAPRGKKSTRRWGELEIDVEETNEYVRFSNTEELMGEIPEGIYPRGPGAAVNPRSIAFAFLSPELLARPYEDYLREDARDRQSNRELVSLWALARPFLQPLELSVNLEPGLLFEITVVSKSILSPILFLSALPSYGEILIPKGASPAQDSP